VVATRASGAADARANHPVVDVSWDDSLGFCASASAVTCVLLELPSEAEWEKAARGADGRINPWGNAPADAARLNYYSHVDATTPVGAHGARGRSPFGCDDMAGNVWEWTRSLWGMQAAKPEFGYPYSTREAEREDLRAGQDVRRVLRGGSFNNLARDVRCASRHADLPGASGDRRGFRVVLRLSAD
jgi:serine/threonine-protein kinase